MDDLLNEFLTETAESIDVVDVELVKLEQDPNNKDVLDNIFRLVHTIKGTCGFLGLPRLEAVAHSSENVLGKFRDGDLEVTPNAVTVILESLDRIKEILAGLEASEQEPEGDDSALIARLDAIAAGEAAEAPAAEAAEADDASSEPEAVDDSPADEASGDAPAATEGGDGEVDEGLGRPLKPGEVSLDELEAAFASADGPGAGAGGDETAQADGPADSDGPKPALFDRVGGDDTIAVMSHVLATRLPKQGKLGDFFADVDEDVRKAKMTGLLTALFKDDETAAGNVGHALVGKPGFVDEHFDAFTELARAVFEEVQLDTETRDDGCMALELVRQSVLDGSASHGEPTTASGGTGGEAAQKQQASDTPRSSQTIRVSVDLLEDLMNMVSELVLTRNQLLQMVRGMEESEFAVPLQHLSQTTTELQEGVMKTRMQPIGNAWAKLPRIVRDLSLELDKKIELDMLGADTELDRQVLELIKDPLTHMVRNSADHGIETPAERVAMGKAEGGTVRLNAFHEGGHIIIEISDDGRGLSVAKLRKKALEKGLASEAAMAEMSDNQIQKFIFHPGFSTAAKVTNVSGRGVGMDVVRSNIEQIGGTIDMTSVEGKGTTFQIKIPLTLAIVSGLIVQASGERFAIPQISVLELVRASSDSDHTIEKIKDTPVLRLRNRLLPLVYLNDVLGFDTQQPVEDAAAPADGDGRAEAGEAVERSDDRERSDDFIVVTQVGAFTFGIVVDQVFDTEEIVVKPVAPILKHLPTYSGNTILGDGSVIMILDPNGIASLANSGVGEAEDGDGEQAVARTAAVSSKEALLVFRAGNDSQKAVPLSLVARLEDIPVETIEESDGRRVVQYRGALMPVILVDGSLGLQTEGRQPVLVFTDGDYAMGLAVDEILDILEDNLEIKLASDTHGVIGSAIIDGKATEVIDVSYYMRRGHSEWMQSQAGQPAAGVDGTARVLLVDDSAFFRNMLKPLLTVAGYDVTTVSGAQEALELREEGKQFDLIISDIEMPGMDGFELAQILKKGGRWQDTPLVALSSLTSDRDLDRGRQVGFNDYVAKFDRDRLLHSLSQQLKISGDAA